MGGKLNKPFPLTGKTVWVAGETGMVGSATIRRLASEDCTLLSATRKDFDLRDQSSVATWMKDSRPNIVVVAAATVGGIYANSTRPAEFLYDNLMIESNIIHAAHEAGTEKLLFLGSACIYPRDAAQPMAENALLTGPPWSRLMSGTQSPRSQASSYAKHIENNTVQISFQPSQIISTGQGIISICSLAMLSLR